MLFACEKTPRQMSGQWSADAQPAPEALCEGAVSQVGTRGEREASESRDVLAPRREEDLSGTARERGVRPQQLKVRVECIECTRERVRMDLKTVHVVPNTPPRGPRPGPRRRRYHPDREGVGPRQIKDSTTRRQLSHKNKQPTCFVVGTARAPHHASSRRRPRQLDLPLFSCCDASGGTASPASSFHALLLQGVEVGDLFLVV